jgi:competence ComEA-like helix-hairpin-helix protein
MSRWLAKIQSWTHASKQEIVAVGTVLGLTTAAALVSYYRSITDAQATSSWIRMLDSLAQESIEIDTPTTAAIDAPSGGTTTAAPNGERFRSYQPKKPPSVPINVNTATKQELMRLPGVGEVMASRIMAERTKRPFTSPEDLMRVPGIGKKKLEQLRPYIRTDSQ